MLRLIFAFVDIMLHRRGPDSIPSAPFLFWTLLVLCIVADWLALGLAGEGPRAFAVSLLATGFDLWFIWAVLRTFNKTARFRQTMTALLGAELLLSILQAPLIRPLAERAAADPQNQLVSFPDVLVLVILIWCIDINAFVLARALERPYLLCAALALGYFFLMQILQATLLRPIP